MSAPAKTRLDPSKYNYPLLQFENMLLSKHYSKRAKKNVRYIAIHHMTIVGDGKGSALVKCYNVWQERAASAHYGIDGAYIAQYVWDKDYAWATGSTAGNEYGISIEHANSSVKGWVVGDTTWKNGTRLVAQLHLTYKLGRPVKDKTVRKHSSFIATGCPGPYLGDQIWNEYVRECQRQYDLLVKVPVKPIPPATKRPQLEILSNNVWGYGDTRSGASQAKRMPLVVDMIDDHKPHLFAVQELSNQTQDRIKHRGDLKERTPREYLDFYLHDLGYKRDAFGSDGRFIYRDTSEVNFITGKTILMKPEYQKDDKQAAVGVYERGRKFAASSFHLENDQEDNTIRMGQVASLLKQTYDFTKPLGVNTRWQFHAGDANMTVGAEVAFGKKGFVDGAMRVRAAKRTNEEYKSFEQYMRTDLGRRIDFIMTYKDIEGLEFEQIIDYPTSDHNPQRLLVQL